MCVYVCEGLANVYMTSLRISVEILVSNIIIFHEFINYTKRAANPITKPISYNVKLQIVDHALMMILFSAVLKENTRHLTLYVR